LGDGPVRRSASDLFEHLALAWRQPVEGAGLVDVDRERHAKPSGSQCCPALDPSGSHRVGLVPDGGEQLRQHGGVRVELRTSR
jgi:hypothetical protein